MAIKPIQTIEGGPEYDSWATSTQMDRLIATLQSTGISQNNAKDLVSLLDNINDGGKVDTKVLQQVLGNLKTTSADEKIRDKADEAQDKAQRSFWQQSTQNAQAATRAFKNANIADALRETRDLGMVPIESLSDAFTKATTIVSSFATGIFGAANSIISSLGSIGAGVGKILGFVGGIIGGIGGLLATGVAALVGAIDGMGDVFFSLYNTGINMAYQQGQTTHGLSALAMAASKARMTIGEFGEFISENSRVAVAIGADAMGQLSNTVRKALIPIGQLGLSMSETNEYMADWLEMTRMTNMLDGMERAKQATGAEHYLMLLTDLSRVTGKRRDQINDELKAMAADPGYQSAMQGIPEGIRDTVVKGNQLMVGYFGTFGDEFGKGLTDAVKGFDLLVTTDLGQSLMAASLTQEHAALQQLINQNRLGQVGEKEMKVRLQGIKESIVNNAFAANNMMFLSQGVSDVHYAAQRLKTSMINAGEITEEQAFRFATLERGYANMNEFFRGLSQTWTNFIATLFADEGFKKKLDTFAKAFEEFMKPDGPFAKNMESFAGMLAGGLLTGLEALSTAMADPNFQATMAEIPGMFVSFGNALKDALTFIRNIFWKKDEETGVWKLKSGEDMMLDAQKAMKGWWTNLTKPGGLLEGTMDGVGEAVGVIMSAAFTKIADLIWTSAKDTFKKMLNWLPWVDMDLSTKPDPTDAKYKGETGPGSQFAIDNAAYQKEKATWSGGDTAMATAGVVVGTVVGNKIWNGSKWVVNTAKAVTTTAAAATATAEKKAADKVITSAAKKLGVRYGGAAAFGPWAGFAAIGISVAFAGHGAMDAIINKSEELTGKSTEAITVMDKMKVGVSGAIDGITAGIISSKTAYEVLNTEVITWGKTGADRGLLNKLWDGPSFLPEWLTKKRFAGSAPGEETPVDPMHQIILDEIKLMDLRTAAIDNVTTAMTTLKTLTTDMYSQVAMLGSFAEKLQLIGNQAAGITTVKDSIVGLIKNTSTDEAFRSASVIQTMATEFGKLDDKMNDWDKGELKNFDMLTNSLGQLSGANIEHQQLLEGIKTSIDHFGMTDQVRLIAIHDKLKEIKIAVKANGPYAD